MAPRQRRVPIDDDSTAEASTLLSEQAKGAPRKPSTLKQIEADIARDRHDYFNLATLVFIIGSTALNYDINITELSLHWSGNYFWLNWVTTLLYFFSDLVWVAVVPICVKSPGMIIKHHIVAMVYLVAPVCYPEYRWFMGSILSVEVNTWFLIMRRVVFKTSRTKPVSPVVGYTVSGMFYLTWILIRCIIYPQVLVTFLKMAAERIQETGTFFHLPMVFIPAHAALCILNLKWTYDLFTPIIKRWLGIVSKPMVVQNGL